MAGISDASRYLNAFRSDKNKSAPLEELLQEVWDFDSEIVTPQNGGPIKPDGKPIRAYWQGVNDRVAPWASDPNNTITILPRSRWVNYQNAPNEIPPLPPKASNSKKGDDDINEDTEYIHHLIRDFMFTDATLHNESADGLPYTPHTPRSARLYRAVLKDLKVSDFATEDPKLGRYTRGTGPHQVDLPKQHVVDLDEIHNKNPLTFSNPFKISYTAKYYQLTTLNGTEVSDISKAPNWFGVAVPGGCTDFSNVIIYFHPTPGQALYDDRDYPKRDGASGGANWKELFGYVDRLGIQLAVAVEKYKATPNQIVIVPFMTGSAASNAGILPEQWYYIVSDILDDLYTHGV